MKPRGQGAETANNGGKGPGREHHKTNHGATWYRAREGRELRIRDREPEKQQQKKTPKTKGDGEQKESQCVQKGERNNSKTGSRGSQRQQDGERTKATGYRAEREELMNRHRELGRKRWRKAEDHTANREERREGGIFKTGARSQREGERRNNKMGTGHRAARRESMNKNRRPKRTQCRMEKRNSGLQGRRN